MAMPGNVLSSTPVPAPFIGARGLAVSDIVDYEDGPVAIQDPSEGLNYQRWRMRLIGSDLLLSAPNTPEYVALTLPGVTECSFTFDQNARLTVAYVQSGQAKLRWFDSVPGMVVTTDLAPGVITPRIILDDKRFTQVALSDIVMQYVRGGALYMRMQRDRFLIEYQLHPGLWLGIAKYGFTSQLRLQTLMRYQS